MASVNNHADVVIIGGGIAGLMAAIELQERNRRVIILDKGRSVGGRLATRRIGPGRADHGAQFFTVRDLKFQQIVDEWLDAGVVFKWSMGWSDGSLLPVKDDGHPRYAVNEGMNALPRYLEKKLDDVRANVTVTGLRPLADGRWTIEDNAGGTYISKSVILTPPVPQSLELLDASDVRLVQQDRQALEKIRYQPCLTGIFWLAENVRLPEPGAVQRRSVPISWIANNTQKGISPQATIITVQADGEYSAQLWNDDDERILNALRTDLIVWLPDGNKIVEEQLKRWRYSAPTVVHPGRYLRAEGLPPLVFAGDAFGGPRVEGAVLSGLAAAHAIP